MYRWLEEDVKLVLMFFRERERERRVDARCGKLLGLMIARHYYNN